MIHAPGFRPNIKIISGGQSGADRAALDWAIEHGLPHGGWCPKGRKAEDGQIPGKYQLLETPNRSYLQRTEWNVRESDATVIFTLNEPLDGGSKRTAEFAEKHHKPYLHIWRETPINLLLKFLEQHFPRTLNVAGKRESSAPGIGEFTKQILYAVPNVEYQLRKENKNGSCINWGSHH